jgi:hypothetical protein
MRGPLVAYTSRRTSASQMLRRSRPLACTATARRDRESSRALDVEQRGNPARARRRHSATGSRAAPPASERVQRSARSKPKPRASVMPLRSTCL